MKRMKCIPAVLLLLTLLLGLTACGTGASAPSGTEPAGTAAGTGSPETASPTLQPTNAPTEAPSSAQTSEPTAEATPELTPEPTPEPTPDTTPDPTPNIYGDYTPINMNSPAVLRGTADMGQEYIDSITFLGDSTTYGLKAYAVLSDGKQTKQVWTPSNGTLTLSYQGFVDILYPDDGVEISIRAAVERKKPERMIITLGVNGISFMDKDYFISEYTDLVTDIQEISPDTLIILQSIFPIASNYEYKKDINNQKICLPHAPGGGRVYEQRLSERGRSAPERGRFPGGSGLHPYPRILRGGLNE